MRLQEGFHFAQTLCGVVNLMIEVDVKRPDDCSEPTPPETNPSDDSAGAHIEDGCSEKTSDVSPCVVQYVMFPPHTTTSRE